MPFVGELGERRDGLGLDFVFRPLQHRQQVLDAFLIADLADRANDGRQGFRFARAQHFEESGQGLGAAYFGECIHRAFTHPPIGVLGGFDQLRHGAFVLGLVEDLDGGPPDVLIFVLDEREHGIDDAWTADLAQSIRRARAHPPIAVGDHFQQVFDRFRGADDI